MFYFEVVAFFASHFTLDIIVIFVLIEIVGGLVAVGAIMSFFVVPVVIICHSRGVLCGAHCGLWVCVVCCAR